ncbi:MAG: MBL fold metallo-hydrolase [Actinomycetota bacterium]|nr:MBL fold metallo-hydrolase [Actinomycetota bacterium]
MFFEQFVLESLGHASYIVGDEKTGHALVLDPRRDVDVYFDYARSKGLRLQHAIDTHGHNDYLSGLQEIVARQRVEVLGYVDADLGYDHRAVKDGEVVEMGDVRFEVVHTPGHTPEHVSLLVYDDVSAKEPALMLSGGALLVGDLARPDLLGGEEGAKEAATEFCHTIQEKILWQLSDHVEVFPTHVSGSLCGGNIGSRLSTTLGYERKTNAILARVSSSEEFVEECIRLDNLPAVPPYWRRMRAQNLAGPDVLGVLGEPPALQPDEVEDLQERGAIVLDARSPEGFSGAHVPRSINVGLGSSFPTWAGTVLAEGAEVVLVLEDPSDLWVATWELLRIGYNAPVGWLAGGIASWRASGRRVATLPLIDVHQLYRGVEKSALNVLDVRQPAEWAGGHIRGAEFITGADLPERVDDVPSDKPVAVVCGSGYRSSVMASLLASAGRERVFSVIGGMSAWRASGYETVTE